MYFRVSHFGSCVEREGGSKIRPKQYWGRANNYISRQNITILQDKKINRIIVLQRYGFLTLFLNNFALIFKTYSGHGSDYLLIHLKDGGVSLTINQRSGKLDTQVKPAGEPFNDNVWHQVTVTRETNQVARTRDQQFLLLIHVFQQPDGQTSCQVICVCVCVCVCVCACVCVCVCVFVCGQTSCHVT